MHPSCPLTFAKDIFLFKIHPTKKSQMTFGIPSFSTSLILLGIFECSNRKEDLGTPHVGGLKKLQIENFWNFFKSPMCWEGNDRLLIVHGSLLLMWELDKSTKQFLYFTSMEIFLL